VCNNANEQYPNLSRSQRIWKSSNTLLKKETEGVELVIVHVKEEPSTTITFSSAHWSDLKSWQVHTKESIYNKRIKSREFGCRIRNIKRLKSREFGCRIHNNSNVYFHEQV